MPKLVECPLCSSEVPKLRPEGYCQSCHSFNRTNPLKNEDRGDFPWEETLSGPKSVSTVVCAKCGGSSFLVGKGNYKTFVRCVVCLNEEACVHEG